MDRYSRSPDLSDGRRYGRRRRHSRSYSRSRSRSRNRSRERRRRYSRSISRERIYRRGGSGGASNGDIPDLYKDMIDPDYDNDRDNGYSKWSWNKYRANDRNDRRDRRERSERYYHRGRGHSSESSNDSFTNEHVNYRNQTPTNKIIILGLAKHLTEADINNDLIHFGIQSTTIRLIRKRKTGTSRGFAFVEFNTEEEASRWMEYKQGVLMIQDQCRAIMQYSVTKEAMARDKIITDWYCAKCGIFNFKRRDNCFKCNASREESEKGGEGSDEVSSILTKKIMLRNLDVLTNEEGVLTSMQEVVPTLVSKISKILICRDPLTSTSRGVCYLSFDNLVDSMNTHNALKALEPPLTIDNREILITYCVDMENRQLNARHNNGNNKYQNDSNHIGKSTTIHQYTLADVPRLAEYSASVYAQNVAEHDYYFKYYTDYYVDQINKGLFSNLPTMSQIGETANSGAAVALSAIQRKQQKQYQYGKNMSVAVATPTAHVVPVVVHVPNGNDNRKYPTPDISQYQYDESSGYYYDPSTGLYYDSNSQYYYNSEISAYLYWDQEKSTYLLAAQSDSTTSTSSSAVNNVTPGIATVTNTLAQPQTVDSSETKDSDGKKTDQKHDKVKVAKKIVKDMEKWAKQLNQKKDMNAFQAVQPPAAIKEDEPSIPSVIVRQPPLQRMTSGYADVGFSILENRDGRIKSGLDTTASSSKVLPAASYTSDSDNEPTEQSGEINDKELVDFDKLACLLCKRAFQSLDILNKHIKMSKLHKENLQKHKLRCQSGSASGYNSANDTSSQSYRDRAKERRLKYGEVDPPPPNRSRERFEKELRKQTVQLQKQTSSNLATMPIGESNVGNRLLQKMGWSEGQGLGRSNQGRTKIIEAESRAPSAGLGSKTSAFVPGDDYRTYIKRMMKSRYEQAD